MVIESTKSRLEGAWIVNNCGIKKAICEHFDKAFQSDKPEPENGILECVPCQITYEMNEDLCRTVTIEEVRGVVFQLGRARAPGPEEFPGLFNQRN